MPLPLNKLTPLKIKFHRVNQEAVRALPLYNMMYTDALSLLDTSDPSINIADQCNFCLFELIDSQNNWITFKIGITINSKLGKTRETKVVYHRNILYIFDEYDLKHPLCDKYDRENEEYLIVDGSYDDLMKAVNSNGCITVKSGRILYENDNKNIFSKVNTDIELGYKDSYRAETVSSNSIALGNKILDKLKDLGKTDEIDLFNNKYFIDSAGNPIYSIFSFSLWHELSNSNAMREISNYTIGILPEHQLANRICNFHNTVVNNYLSSNKIQTSIIGLMYLEVLYDGIYTAVEGLIKGITFNDEAYNKADLVLISLNEAIEYFNTTEVKVHIRSTDDPKFDDSTYEAYTGLHMMNKWLKDTKSKTSDSNDVKFKKLVRFMIERSDDTLCDDLYFGSLDTAVMISGKNFSNVELKFPVDCIINYNDQKTEIKKLSPQLVDIRVEHLAAGYLDTKNKTFLSFEEQDGSVKPRYSTLHTIGKILDHESDFYYISLIEDVYLGILRISKDVRDECSGYLLGILTTDTMDFLIRKYSSEQLNVEHFNMMYKCLKDKSDIITLFMEDN